MNFLRRRFTAAKRAARIIAGKDVYIPKQLDCNVVYFGKAGTCWPVCPEALPEQPLVYSFGVGEDVSFDLELIRCFHATIHAFDPTPCSVAWIAGQQLPANFNFHACGIADKDGVCSFLPPANPAHVSHTMIARQSAAPSRELPVKRMRTFMSELQQARVDLLKMDIEGAEYDVIQDLIASGIVVKQLLVEFHHRWKEIGVSKTKEAIRHLNVAGYRIFAVSPSGEEYGFLNFDGTERYPNQEHIHVQ
jgi:FkbM family methyltransferase